MSKRRPKSLHRDKPQQRQRFSSPEAFIASLDWPEQAVAISGLGQGEPQPSLAEVVDHAMQAEVRKRCLADAGFEVRPGGDIGLTKEAEAGMDAKLLSMVTETDQGHELITPLGEIKSMIVERIAPDGQKNYGFGCTLEYPDVDLPEPGSTLQQVKGDG